MALAWSSQCFEYQENALINVGLVSADGIGGLGETYACAIDYRQWQNAVSWFELDFIKAVYGKTWSFR